MDDKGRLHMPNGFVGKTFDETGLLKEMEKQTREIEPDGNNRKARRKAEAMMRKLRKNVEVR